MLIIHTQIRKSNIYYDKYDCIYKEQLQLLEMNNELASRHAQLQMQSLQNDIAILNSIQNINIKLVITNIDKKMGRGLHSKATPVKKTAIKYSYQFFLVFNP